MPAVSDLSLQAAIVVDAAAVPRASAPMQLQCDSNKSAAQQADDLVESHPPAVSCSAAGL